MRYFLTGAFLVALTSVGSLSLLADEAIAQDQTPAPSMPLPQTPAPERSGRDCHGQPPVTS